ncbi:MAG: response regulator [Lachnospiraceae bacterium]|nr:response regulator [Lachnospiraceae bacterium]
MKVLFIDSEPLFRKELMQIIPWSSYGFSNFFEADNGSGALRLIDSENPDLILLDINLNDMSGIDFIHEAKKKDYTGKFIIISEDTYFTNAKKAINYGVTAYLDKPADPDDLADAVSRAVDDIYRSKLVSIYYDQSARLSKNNVLSSILLGSMAYVTEMESIYHIKLDSDYYRLVSFILPEKKYQGDIWQEALALTRNCISVVFSETKLVFIISSLSQEQFIQKQLKTCQEDYPQYAFLLGIISSQAGSHTELSSLYDEIQQIEHNLYYYKEIQNRTLYADSLSQRLGRIHQMDWNLIDFTENIIRHILLLQGSEIEECILSLLDFLALRKPPRDSARFILINCYSQIVSTLIEHYPQLEFEMSDRQAIASRISYDRYLCDSISYLNDQFQKAVAYIRIASRKNPCQRICQYIDMNYASPLQLNTLSNLLGYNSTYMGRLFLQETGVSFNTYLDKVRIKKAAEYLEKGVPVIQTSELSGFNNPDYFTKKFKKYMGILPSEYRTQHMKKYPAQITPPQSKKVT